MKKIVWPVIMLCLIVLANWGVAVLLNGAFIEYAFLVGLLSVVIIWFFTSSGGYSSNIIRMNVQSQTGIKVDGEERQFNPSVVFYTAVFYLVIATIATFFYYMEYW